MMMMLRKLTSKELPKQNEDSSDEDCNINNKNKTLRGKKYDFIKKIMKRCNSTDLGDITVYCKNTVSKKKTETIGRIYSGTP